jgi:hypothetical protein
MRATKIVRGRKPPQTPEEFYELGAQLDAEAKILSPLPRQRGFVLKARTWEELESWQKKRLRARGQRIRAR